MDEIKIISENKLRNIAGEKGFNLIYLEKDYFLTLLLYLLHWETGLLLKGGTAINKIFLNHARLSEDLDFSCRAGIESAKKALLDVIGGSRIFKRHEFGKTTPTFFRLKAHYDSYFTKDSFILVDVNAKSSIKLPTEEHDVPHFYDSIPEFKANTLALEEIVAEKIRALITRNQPRDYFDTYLLLKQGNTINKELLGTKLSEAGQEFNTERIFKNAKKIFSNWDSEISQLTNRPISYETVIKYLHKEFRCKS